MAYIYSAKGKPATDRTAAHNASLRTGMDRAGTADEDHAIGSLRAHTIYALPIDEPVRTGGGRAVLSAQPQADTHRFPDDVNPYLWRQAQDRVPAGIVELVPDAVYTTYGMSASAIGLIRSEHGWVVQDAGGSIDEAEAALDAFEEALGEPVRGHIVAVIVSHTHIDHFGGLEVFLPKGKPGAIPVFGPAGFMESMVDENLYTGAAMNRRIQYQIGARLPAEERLRIPFLTSMLRCPCGGRTGTALPDRFIGGDETVEIDGLEVAFTQAPQTETQAHMVSYFTKYRALYLADVAIGSLHNTLTMRGAQVRDANAWGQVLYRLARQYGDRAQALWSGHGTPIWDDGDDPARVRRFLLDNAASYKATNDQALLLANEGLKPDDISRALDIPESVRHVWYTRGNYGAYTFNARASYQKYLGFYDGDPIHLEPLPESERARRLIVYLGGADAALARLEKDYARGDYQWVAELSHDLLLADPGDDRARYLCADALEQLAYQAESALWRNAYLTAAIELRHPDQVKRGGAQLMGNDGTVPLVGAGLLLDHIGINFDGGRADREARSGTAPVPVPPEYLTDGISFTLNLIDGRDGSPIECQDVLVYKGAVMHAAQGAGPDGKGPVAPFAVSATRDALYKLATKRYGEVAGEFTTDRRDVLAWLDEYIVDLSAFADFPIVAPSAPVEPA